MIKLLLGSLPSLRYTLLVPYIVLVLTMALIIGVSSYRAGTTTIESVSAHLLEETAQRLTQATLHHLVGSAAVLEAAFPNDMPAPENLKHDERELINRFWIATSLHLDPNNYVYFGNEIGQGFGLFRRSREQAELRIKYEPDLHRSIYRLNGLYGHLEYIDREARLFDPRTRPWYRAAQNSTHHTWTSVYIDFGSLDLVATRARSVHSKNGDFNGVVATDVSLRALNQFIHTLKPSPNGLVMLVEEDGALIASSNGSNILTERHIGVQRRNVKNGIDSLARFAFQHASERLNQTGESQTPQTFSFQTPEGDQINAAVNWVQDDAGLKWLAIVAMPKSDFLGSLTHSAKVTAAATGITVLLALVLGLTVVHWVTEDLARLARATHKIGKGQTDDVRLHINRRDEIGRLARSFEDMHAELSTDRLTGLTSRTALMRQLKFAIQSRQQNSEDGFAVLFIDLNRFKEINDRYGHDAGDLALIEASQRLRNSVRQSDLVARLGGDEFVVILWDTHTKAEAKLVCDKIIRQISKPLTGLNHITSDKSLSVGAAIGISLFPQDGNDITTLLKTADHNMYRDKESNR